MPTITAHCLVKNEENFIWYAVKSVIDFVDKIIIFDTGSKDKTIEIIKTLVREYPNKIFFEEKGECDKKRHTELRQEMLDRTTTDWFMILDGDEVWTNRAIQEALKEIQKNQVYAVESFFYMCVGDVFHTHYKKSFKTIRFIKNDKVNWKNDYGFDTIISKIDTQVITKRGSVLLKNKFWHLTHLPRSNYSKDVFSSGGTRSKKVIKTYFLIGKKILEKPPEVFVGLNLKLSAIKSFFYFFIYILNKIKAVFYL